MPRVAEIPYERQDPHSRRLMDAVDFRRFEVTAEQVRRARHASFANISYLDDRLGELLQQLERCDFADSTYVILCADHGDMLGERGLWYKMNFFEASCRVPLLIAAPRATVARRVAAPVALHDLLPTLFTLAGGDADELNGEIDGRCLAGLAGAAAGRAQAADASERAVYAEYCAEGSVAPMVMVRRGHYKFCMCPADPPQLFDLARDPLELDNLAPVAAHAGTVAQFMAEVEARWDLARFDREVRQSQKNRHLVNEANRQGRFTSWDFQPQLDARERFMRNHLDLNVLELDARYPKR
jgi:choline-sulfatase